MWLCHFQDINIFQLQTFKYNSCKKMKTISFICIKSISLLMLKIKFSLILASSSIYHHQIVFYNLFYFKRVKDATPNRKLLRHCRTKLRFSQTYYLPNSLWKNNHFSSLLEVAEHLYHFSTTRRRKIPWLSMGVFYSKQLLKNSNSL